MQIKTKIVSSHTAESKPVKQEVNRTLILLPLVFPDPAVSQQSACVIFSLSFSPSISRLLYLFLALSDPLHERERERKREREIEGDVEYAALKRMTGALAPFSYLVFYNRTSLQQSFSDVCDLINSQSSHQT